MAESPLRFGCVILAAGASTRMGSPKQLLSVAGQPLLGRVVEEVLASSAWPVIVILGAEAEKIRPVLARYPVLIGVNETWAEGMASSIRTGVALLRQFSRALAGASFVLCDQPAFSAATLARLAGAQAATGRSIAAARYRGRLGAPALFLREHFPALAALTGDAGARGLLERAGEAVAAVDLPELGVDLDTPADVAAYRSIPPG